MTAKKARASATLEARQVRSGICANKTQKATLKALGLGKIGRVRTFPDNDQIRGMIAKIPHLVEIVGEGASAGRAR